MHENTLILTQIYTQNNVPKENKYILSLYSSRSLHCDTSKYFFLLFLHFESKTGQKGYESIYQKEPQQMQNFLHEEKVIFLVRIYHYILLTTSVW